MPGHAIAETLTTFAAAEAPLADGRVALADVPEAEWRRLIDAAVESNGFYDPGFAVNAAKFARGGHGGEALLARAGERLIGFMPVVSALRAYRLPIPAFVGTVPYSVYGAPLLAQGQTERAAESLLAAAAQAGAQLLVLPMLDLDGPAMAAFTNVLARRGQAPLIHREHERAALAVPEDAETYLRAGMGAKKLKELRRQRHRLDEEGAVAFALAATPEAVVGAIDRFLELEARGWKGKNGTGLGQSEGDARFAREAALALARAGTFEVLELTLDGRVLASGLVLRQRDTALFFKIAYDEAFSRFSPGVQLTVELTRRFAADPTIAYADSTALPGHPMIDHVWRERRRVGDVLVPTRPGAAGLLWARLVIARDWLRERAKSFVHAFRHFREKRT
jgi:CelD/BcsL family acetyltransferase involved in cellulose biosynthesis